ncbi:MAG: hypothetical protein LUI87_06675 [Lachnospiraceae bacterium]|nr:hypothetical protein [Lachnospiraceae bacterium]
MKIRTALISIVLSAAMIAGGVYGAYHFTAGNKTPVEVVPVSNVAFQYADDLTSEDTIYGEVTSQVSQNVTFDSEYEIAEIYVSEGDEVTEGTPLFSYDMTEQEIKLEGEDIYLQRLQLKLTRKNKDLEKYQKMTAIASLDHVSSVLTTASMENDDFAMTTVALKKDDSAMTTVALENDNSAVLTTASMDEIVEESGDEIIEEPDTENRQEETAQSDTAQSETEGTGLDIESVEDVTDESSVLKTAVLNYELLMNELKSFINEYRQELSSDEIGESLLKAVEFYRNLLADEVAQEEEDFSDYTIKDSVKGILTEDELEDLESYVELMDTYHALYVDLLIREASALSEDALAAAAAAAREEYANLSKDAAEQVTQLELLESLEAALSETENETESGTEAETETDLIVETELEMETEAESGMEAETETESEAAGTEAETETESEAAGTEAETETEFETGTEAETETENGTEMEPETKANTETNTEENTETNTETNTKENTETNTEKETTAEGDSAAETIDTASLIRSFVNMADSMFSETNSPEMDDYLNAISFYQMYLAAPAAEFVGEAAALYSYELTAGVLSSLQESGIYTEEEIENLYRNICLAYARSVVASLEPETMTREEYDTAYAVYESLGIEWQASILEESPSLADYLEVYDMALSIKELDPDGEDFYSNLENLYYKYLSLTEIQTALVWNADTLLELAAEYGLVENETESEWYDWDDWGDYYGYDDYDDGTSMTAAEIKEQIETLEDEIKSLELEIREQELTVAQAQRIVDQKTVTSKLDGTVVSVGDMDGDSDDEYFVKVTSTVGLYAKGLISEMALESVSVGDSISGRTSYTGETFTAVIKEISEYPESNPYEYTDDTYYPFYALIDDAEGLEEGDAELTLSTSYVDDGICLDIYLVRKDSSGNNYVYVQGDGGLLEKRYVTVSETYYDTYVKITGGLSSSDLIAFPYGDDVYEGAVTTEKDILSAMNE